MVRRFFMTVLLSIAVSSATAADFTDIWYLAAEAGWGVNVVQSDNFLFLTFFVYGPDNTPTWYVASVTQDASGNFNGPLYAANGTYFAMPWIMPMTPGIQVGTASFQPTTAYTAKLIYSVDGIGTVTKAIQRQALTFITLGGTYAGVAIVDASGCAMAGRTISDVDVTITQQANNSGPISIVLNYLANGTSCTFLGSAIQWGKLYQIPNATYACSNGFTSTAKIDELNATPHGVEMLWTAPVPQGCTESGTFSGALE
jgi:hypothetical protein